MYLLRTGYGSLTARMGEVDNLRLHKELPQSLTSQPFEEYITELSFEFVGIEPGS